MTTQVQDKEAIHELIRRYCITKENFEEGVANVQHEEIMFMFLDQVEDLIYKIIEFRMKWKHITKN